MLKVGMRYGVNLVAMAAQQRGYLTAASVGSRFILSEAAMLLRFVCLLARSRRRTYRGNRYPTLHPDAIAAALTGSGVVPIPYHIDLDAFRAHVASCGYPANYAAGSMDGGGAREQKLLEYFVSLELLRVQSTDVVVDVASEWSIFPEVLRELTGATVYRQDMIYSLGIHGDRIGGSAESMPVPDGFADKLVLHNALEHFEGMADTGFIAEAERVLKPGGMLCILPLLMAERHSIITDPLVDRRGIVWDAGARVVEIPWWHNRFGRFYDAPALQRRVLAPARGFEVTAYWLVNVEEVHPKAYLHFALVMQKPGGPQRTPRGDAAAMGATSTAVAGPAGGIL